MSGVTEQQAGGHSGLRQEVATPRVAHVIYHDSPKPTAAHEDDRIFTYGSRTSGIIDALVIHDRPRDDDDQTWLNTQALTRIAPGGTIYWMCP